MTACLKSFFLFIIVMTCACSKKFHSQKTPDALGWQLAAQTYSFRLFTFEEALRKADSVGVRYVQAFPGQRVGGGIEGTMDYHMSPAKRDSVLHLARNRGITVVSYGVVSPRSDNDWRQLFEFAKGMGIKQFASEPEPEFIPLVSSLADEYKINVAIHNHPRPSRYWNPDTLLKYTAGYSNRLGACADIGHFVRSGLDPVAMLQKLQGRVFELHMKDLHEKPNAEYTAFLLSRPLPGQGQQGRQGSGERVQPPPGPHDVPWGTGISNIKGVLHELKRQGFKGPLIAEYEHNWNHNTPEIAKSLQFVKEVVAEMN